MKKDKNKIKHNYLNLYGAGVQSGYQDQGAWGHSRSQQPDIHSSTIIFRR